MSGICQQYYRHFCLKGWAFAEWLSNIPEADTRQLRHMLLFLLFPDDFERIFGGTDRRAIVAAFTQKPISEVKKLNPIAIDQELHRIRQKAEKEQTGRRLGDSTGIQQWAR